MFDRPRPALMAVLALALPACGDAKPVPVSRLTGPTDSLVASFGEISEAAWLGCNRWGILAPNDEAVAIVDLALHQVRRLGGEGQEEIRNPSTLFRLGDTLAVGDWGLRRTTLWTLEGRAAGAIPAPGGALRGVLPRAVDGAGHFYYELAPQPGPDGLGNRDSAAVVRAAPGDGKDDTLARLTPADIAEVEGDAGRRFEQRVFSGSDRWGVLPDGSLWVARVYENRVAWREAGGGWRKGEPLPDRVLEVTRYDRELFLRKFPPELRNMAEQLPFAAIKPPFEAGLTAAGGDVWLEKSRAPADSVRMYQVVDREGRLRREIHLPGRGRVVAVGDSEVLVVEPGRDGAHLLGFTIPVETATP
jgi:hypothetical protein